MALRSLFVWLVVLVTGFAGVRAEEYCSIRRTPHSEKWPMRKKSRIVPNFGESLNQEISRLVGQRREAIKVAAHGLILSPRSLARRDEEIPF